MSSSKTLQQGHTPIYQCNAEAHQMLRSINDHLHQLCGQHANRLVKVETVDGDVFEGHIVHCDKSILYICLSNEGYARGFFPGGGFNPYYNNPVLPLVLFNLLAITLLH
ncbi:hypothetical protein [Paenibacillus sacheonensis]|uniref:Uncharacterized protein n=1 Tax=Paenibacillus sacheonensis TaxID=742054 RepID=A0A7X4YRT4_9BACL|nr:hypothetical protein [Paenibacillus sacheonensis]MBM7567542.1 hypothetical protein [Paenibacillus sacheonensis]NBC71353.1 hypothetical protein [Paenibacillus sacheonensis]